MPGQATQKRAAKNKATKVAKTQQVLAAVAWCMETEKGSKAAVAWLEEDTGKLPLVTYNQVDYALRQEKERKKNSAKFEDTTPNLGNKMLTDKEEKEVIAWLRASNLRLDGKEDEDLGLKVVAVLRARQNVLKLLHGRQYTAWKSGSRALTRR